MLELLLIWLGLLAALIVFAVGRPREGGVLVLTYFLGLSLIHIPGVLPYLDRTFTAGFDESLDGLRMTLIGMGAFVVGAVAAKRMAPRLRLAALPPPAAFERFGMRALIFGVLSYFVVLPVAARVPSLTALVSPLATLLIIGLWLRLYSSTMHNDWAKTGQTLALLPLLPLATLGAAGFLGYGIYWILSVATFLFVISRQRVWFYVSAPVVVYVGLSLFVAYMGERAHIRDLVWNQNATLGQRVGQISGIFTHFEPLDIRSDDHAYALNERLDQNYLVGVGMQRHQQGLSPFLHGETVPVWVVVPRALWPDKPTIGGGKQLVADFTGLTFNEDTSVGSGQVLEFYMNFGAPGVVVGFLILGFVLMRLDHGIMRALGFADLRTLLKYAMPGLTLMQPGGNLMEILIAVVAAVVGAYALSWVKVMGLPPPRRRLAQGPPASMAATSIQRG